jgi:O-antigen/teichoic acid export membrane protein
LTLTAVATYISLIDAGVQSHFINQLNKNWARGEKWLFQRQLHTVIALFGFFVVLVVPLVTLIARVTPLHRLLNLSQVTAHDAGWILVLCAISYLLNGFGAVIGGLHGCVNTYHLYVKRLNAVRIGQILAIAGVLLLYPRPVLIAVALVGGSLANVGFNTSKLLRSNERMSFGVKAASISVLLDALRGSALFLLPALAQLCWLQGTSVVVAALCGSAIVANFVVPRTLFLMTRQVHSAFNQSLWHEVTKLDASNEVARAARLFRDSSVWSAAFGASAAALLCQFGGQIIELWTGGRIHLSSMEQWSFTLLVLSTGFWYSPQVFLMATDHQRSTALKCAVSGLCSIVGSLLLVPRFGAGGAALALLISDIPMSATVLHEACKVVGIEKRELLAGVYGRSLSIFFCGVLAAALVRDAIGSATITGLFLSLAVAGLLQLPIVLSLVSSDARNALLARVRFSCTNTQRAPQSSVSA